MNYYEKHLGDYARDTGHLSQAEHGAYNLLLDRYYATEQGIPAEIVYSVGRAVNKSGRAVVDSILRQFFHLKAGRWMHGRVEEEIAKVHAKSQKARESAAKRWHSERNANASETHTDGICESHPLQSPVTSHQKKTAKSGKPDPAGFSEWYEAYPRKEARKKAVDAWLAAKPDLQTVLAAVAWQRKAGCLVEAFAADGRSVIPLPASWLNGRRWEDERPGPQIVVTGPNCCYCPSKGTEQIGGAWYCASHAKDEREFLGRAA